MSDVVAVVIWLSLQRAAERIGVSPSAFRRYVRKGLIVAYRVRGSRLLRFRAEDVDALVEPVAVEQRERTTLRAVK